MTLTEIILAYRRRAIEAAAVGASAPLASVYDAIVAELAPLVGENGTPAGPAPTVAAPDRMLTVSEVCQLIRASRRFVYAHRKALGGVALSKRALRFPESAITRYLSRRS